MNAAEEESVTESHLSQTRQNACMAKKMERSETSNQLNNEWKNLGIEYKSSTVREKS